MAFANLYSAHVQSVLDLSYPISVDSSFYPTFKKAAKQRILKQWPQYDRALKQAFSNRASNSSWGIVLEENGQPMLVIQNLACRVRNSNFRRLLRINLNDAPTQREPLVWDRAVFGLSLSPLNDTLTPVHNTQMNEVCAPST